MERRIDWCIYSINEFVARGMKHNDRNVRIYRALRCLNVAIEEKYLPSQIRSCGQKVVERNWNLACAMQRFGVHKAISVITVQMASLEMRDHGSFGWHICDTVKIKWKPIMIDPVVIVSFNILKSYLHIYDCLHSKIQKCKTWSIALHVIWSITLSRLI